MDLLLGIFLTSTLAQLVCWWSVFARLGRTTRPLGQAPTVVPGLSVIICARNEAENLERFLPSILRQNYPAFEVIVVDDASTDASPRVLAGFQESFKHLVVLRIGQKTTPGKKAALALGIASARFEHLVLTDADCEPASERWLGGLAAGFGHAPGLEIVLGYGPLRAGAGWWNGWMRFETVFTALQYLALARVGLPYMGVGRNLAWKKNLFDDTAGFASHANLASGDDDLLVNAVARRNNVAVCLDPAAFMYSAAPAGLRAWFVQKHRHLTAGTRYRPLHQAVVGILALSHSLHFLTALILLSAGWGTGIVLAGLAVRFVSVWFGYRKVLPLLAAADLLPRIPLYDALLAFYYAAFVPLALLRRFRGPWK